MTTPQPALLTKLEPIAALSPARVEELASMCMIETVSAGLNPFRMNVVESAQSLYLLNGDLKLVFADGEETILQGGSGATIHPVITDDAPLKDAVALTDIQILRVDADLLDIMLTWDQLANYEKSVAKDVPQQHSTGEWMEKPNVFSAASLKNGLFSALPPENVEEMFRRMDRMPVTAGQIIIREGDEGDYYYLIEEGVAEVSRQDGAPATPRILAQLVAGNAFGEEALVSGNRRNATVTMKTDGVLNRLAKSDFVGLLQQPLLAKVTALQAKELVGKGAQLLDVRLPAEFELGHFQGAQNFPLHDIRESMKNLDPAVSYITYCKSGRRASAAAFILAQHGFRVSSLAT